jgi:hypothetical protein
MIECLLPMQHGMYELKKNTMGSSGNTRQTICMKAKQLVQTGMIWTAKLAKNISICKCF